jgi:hypothetical protein
LKITIEQDGHILVYTPHELADYFQIIGVLEGMLSEFGRGLPNEEDDMVDDE